jgi:hypothetical protein
MPVGFFSEEEVSSIWVLGSDVVSTSFNSSEGVDVVSVSVAVSVECNSLILESP